jgi:hypothetical protein
MCKIRWFLAVLRSFFHSSLLYIFPATLLHQLFFHPPSLHLTTCFLVYLSILFFPNSYTNTLLGILFSSIPCTFPNQCKLCNFTVSVSFFSNCRFLYLLISSSFLFYCHILGLKFFYTFLSETFICFLSLFVSVQVSDAYANVLSITVFFSLNFSLLDMFLF